VRLSEGTSGTRMRFQDGGVVGVFDAEDRIAMPGLDSGNYTLTIRYTWDVDVASLSFYVP